MARPGNTFDEFLGERGNIVKEIQEFLNVVLLYCVDQEEKYEAKPNEIISPEHARSLITSFCTIHSLYGYPRDIGENKDEEGESRKSEKRVISFDQHAVKQIVSEENVRNKTLAYFCEEVGKDDFWQKLAPNETPSMEKLHREPAHIFLQIVLDQHKGYTSDDPSLLARMHLSMLKDGNYLKPTVWVEEADKKCFAVSLGMRPYLRHVYLYAKLSSLTYNNNDAVTLKEVKAFPCTSRAESNQEKYNPEAKSSYKFKKGKDGKEVEKQPISKCPSCKIFFQSEMIQYESGKRMNYFGNCAEFDIVQESNTEAKLNDIKRNAPWGKFQSGCEAHLNALKIFNENIRQRPNRQIEEVMKVYYDDTNYLNQKKALKYKWSDGNAPNELVTIEEMNIKRTPSL